MKGSELGRENEGSKGGGESIDIKRGKQLIVPHFPIPCVWGSGVQLKNQANGHASYTAVNSLKFGYYTYIFILCSCLLCLVSLNEFTCACALYTVYM